MLSPWISWILSPSSSSSSSTTEEEDEYDEQSIDTDDDSTTDESNYENNNVDHNHDNKDQNDTPNKNNDENNHYLSPCDVDDVNDTIPVALAVPEASPAVTVAFPVAEGRTMVAATATATTIVTRPKRQRVANYSGIMRQYQRLWTKQDEIELLKGYLDYVKQKQGPTISLQNDVELFYDDIRHKLDVGFNKNQLVEKLRRLKRKHKMALDKGGKEVSFKNLHDEAIFDISQKIWGDDTGQDDALDGVGGDDLGKVKGKNEQNGKCDDMENPAAKRLRLDKHNGGNAVTAADIHGFIEETMRSCFSPTTKEMLDGAGKGLPGRLVPKPVELCPGDVADEKWRQQSISKLEVYLDRLELLQDQIKAKLEELRSGRG